MKNLFLQKAVVYQISLRSFTREGTFRAAEKMLPHVKDAGVDVVYLTPFVVMDTDMDRSGWSQRQIAAGFETPKNPYRIADYTKVDPEYGTEADARSFTEVAHRIGLKVIFDLVYLHCGPNNVIQKESPDAFQRNEDGSVKTTYWHFPYINFESNAVREYLFANMKYLSEDLGCDGFRCDVGDAVPLDFWKEGFRRCRAVKPDFIGLNEGSAPEALTVFDANYTFHWSKKTCDVVLGEASLSETVKVQKEYEAKCPLQPCDLVYIENHDIANDRLENRLDRRFPVEAGNALFVMNYLRLGIPVLYNGNEIADNALATFFGPVEDPRRAFKTVDWARALQPEGKCRLALLQKLSAMRHSLMALAEGDMTYLETSAPEEIVAFQRKAPNGESILVAVNLSNKNVDFTLEKSSGEILLSHKMIPGAVWHAGPYGYIAINNTERN